MQATQETVDRVPNFFEWWLVDEPVSLWLITTKITHRVLVFFSVPILFKTLFAPWKRDVNTAVNSSLDIIVKVLVDNIISRLVGFFVRAITICVGLLITLLVFISGLVFLLLWLLLPVIIFGVIYWGLSGNVF